MEPCEADEFLRPGMCFWEALKLAKKHHFVIPDDWRPALWDPTCGCSDCAAIVRCSDLFTETVHEHCQLRHCAVHMVKVSMLQVAMAWCPIATGDMASLDMPDFVMMKDKLSPASETACKMPPNLVPEKGE